VFVWRCHIYEISKSDAPILLSIVLLKLFWSELFTFDVFVFIFNVTFAFSSLIISVIFLLSPLLLKNFG